ncbi:hypothetical protein [Streptomyces canus]|uniref:hypothetical protein n=1 Tax=Streptomyces canus TaxID=58343 RepID=UPI002E26F1DB
MQHAAGAAEVGQDQVVAFDPVGVEGPLGDLGACGELADPWDAAVATRDTPAVRGSSGGLPAKLPMSHFTTETVSHLTAQG